MFAVGHSILVIAWHLLANDCDYADLGSEHLTRHHDPEARARYLVRRLEALGHKVTVGCSTLNWIWPTFRDRAGPGVSPDGVTASW